MRKIAYLPLSEALEAFRHTKDSVMIRNGIACGAREGSETFSQLQPCACFRTDSRLFDCLRLKLDPVPHRMSASNEILINHPVEMSFNQMSS